jgi:hypothetical protein
MCKAYLARPTRLDDGGVVKTGRLDPNAIYGAF